MSNPFTGGAQLVAQDGIKLPVANPQVGTGLGPVALSDRGFYFPLSAINGVQTFSLPNPANCIGQPLLYKKIDPSVNAITLVPFGTETIDGAASTILNKPFQTIVLVSDGVNWNVFTNYLNPASGPSGSGTAGFIPLWSQNTVLGNSSMSQDAFGNISIAGNLNVPQVNAQRVFVGPTEVGAQLQILTAQFADLQRKYRLLLKAMFLSGIATPAIISQAPFLVASEIPVSLSTN